MNFKEILELKDKAPIQKMVGKVTAIYEKKPTDRQKSAGIHPQDVVLQDDEGTKVRACIMNEGMHLPPDAKGRRFTFECTPDEKGQPSGLFKNVFNNYHNVQVYRDAVISGDKSKPEPEKDKPAPPREVAMGTATGRADIRDHIAAMGNILRLMNDELADCGVCEGDPQTFDDMVARLATTVYIQVAKDGLIKRRQQVAENVVQSASFTVASVTDAARPETPNPIRSRFTDEHVVGKALKGALSSEEVEELNAQGGYDWEKLYDMLEARFKEEGYKAEDVGAAYDEAKASFTRRTKKFDNPAFCRVILSGVDSFRGAIETAAKIRDEKEQAGGKEKSYRKDEVTTDEIPF